MIYFKYALSLDFFENQLDLNVILNILEPRQCAVVLYVDLQIHYTVHRLFLEILTNDCFMVIATFPYLY